jgi:hypothetical protein
VLLKNYERKAISEVASSKETDALRLEWLHLVNVSLPQAAQHRERGWPISQNHCFARILLDNACGCPWREVIAAPAWKNAPPALLEAALQLGNAVLMNEVDLVELNRRSLRMRGKHHHRPMRA